MLPLHMSQWNNGWISSAQKCVLKKGILNQRFLTYNTEPAVFFFFSPHQDNTKRNKLILTQLSDMEFVRTLKGCSLKNEHSVVYSPSCHSKYMWLLISMLLDWIGTIIIKVVYMTFLYLLLTKSCHTASEDSAWVIWTTFTMLSYGSFFWSSIVTAWKRYMIFFFNICFSWVPQKKAGHVGLRAGQ